MINLPKTCLIKGPPLSGKKEIIYSYLMESLKAKIHSIIITLDQSAEEVKRDLVASRIFFGPYISYLRFIDCYSLQAGTLVPDSSQTKRVSSPLALNEISIALSQIEMKIHQKDISHLVIVDSLSTMLLYSNANAIARFIQVLIAKIKQAGGSVIFTIDQGMHDDKTVVTMEHMMDCIIEVKKEDSQVLIMARGIPGYERWKKF